MRKTASMQRAVDPMAVDPMIVETPHRLKGLDVLDPDVFKATIRRRWKLILATAAVVALLGAILALLTPKHYRATVIAGVTATGDRMDAGELYRGVEVLQQRTIVATVAALASLPETMRQAFAPFPGTQQQYTIDGTVLPNTNLIRIDVEGINPVMAARIANRVPETLALQTRAMYRLYSVATVSAATPPTQSVSPRIGRITLAAFIAGLLLGVAAALAESYIRRAHANARLTDAAPVPAS